MWLCGGSLQLFDPVNMQKVVWTSAGCAHSLWYSVLSTLCAQVACYLVLCYCWSGSPAEMLWLQDDCSTLHVHVAGNVL